MDGGDTLAKSFAIQIILDGGLDSGFLDSVPGREPCCKTDSFDDGGARDARDVAVDFHRARFVHGRGDFEDFDAGVHSFSRRVREEELSPRF